MRLPPFLSRAPVPPFLVGLLLASLALFLYGTVYVHVDPKAFREWIREDGLVEWLTVVGFFACAVVAFRTAAALRREGGRRAAFRCWVLLVLLLLFVCGEEISWGQRIFDWESPPWFQKWNGQQETNLHNLEFGEFSVNRWVFGKFLAVVNVAFALLLPILHRRSERVRALVRRLAIPITQNYQIVVWLAVFLVNRFSVREVRKAEELQEFMGAVMLFLILTHPFNPEDLPAARRSAPAGPPTP